MLWTCREVRRHYPPYLRHQKRNRSWRYSILVEKRARTQLAQAPKGKRKTLRSVTRRHPMWRRPRKTCAVKPKKNGKQKNQLLFKASLMILKCMSRILRTIQEFQLSTADGGAKPALPARMSQLPPTSLCNNRI